jgi:hypothetical protein
MGYTFRIFFARVWMPWKESSVRDERRRFAGECCDDPKGALDVLVNANAS